MIYLFFQLSPTRRVIRRPLLQFHPERRPNRSSPSQPKAALSLPRMPTTTGDTPVEGSGPLMASAWDLAQAEPCITPTTAWTAPRL